jgi:hypothetical protein
MKKPAKVEYGITITKPWSKEMYDHNEDVAEVVTNKVQSMWAEALNECQDELGEEFMTDVDWSLATPEMVKIQKAVTCYGFGAGYTIAEVAEAVEMELDRSASFRLKEIAEELDIVLEKGFIGFN